VTIKLPLSLSTSLTVSWDLSVRLGYFVTKLNLHHCYHHQQQLGFERKARLFCDFKVGEILEFKIFLRTVGI